MEMIKKVHSYSILDIPKLEAWLKEESKKGLRLVKVSGSVFFFRECEPKEREYFFYQSTGDRNGSFWGSFAACQRQYGLRKSELNRQSGHCFEVDPQKMDRGYFMYKKARTAHYRKDFRTSLILYLIFFFVSLGLAIFAHLLFLLGAALFLGGCIHSIYCLLSLKRNCE